MSEHRSRHQHRRRPHAHGEPDPFGIRVVINIDRLN